MAAIASIEALTDSQLYNKCKEYGANARLWMRKFAGLLPEVYKRQLYKHRGYTSIYEFAAKMAGMNFATTDKLLKLATRLDDKPKLKEQLTSGSQGWSKLEKVSYIATKNSDEFWAKKVSDLSKQSLEMYVHEVRKMAETQGTPERDLVLDSSLTALAFALERERQYVNFSCQVSLELDRKLRLFKQKLEKEKSISLTWGEAIEDLVLRYEKSGGKSKDAPLKANTSAGMTASQAAREQEESQKTHAKPAARYIPKAVRDVVDARTNYLCAFPSCRQPRYIYHHTKRFALDQQHDPNFIVALCRAHERLIHSGLIENEELPPSEWKLRKNVDVTSAKFGVDQMVSKYRQDPVHGFP